MKVRVHGPNLADQSKGTFVVHEAECRDNARVRYLGNHSTEGGWELEVESRTELCDEVYPPGDFECESGEYLGDLHFAPCCRGLV